LNVIFHTPQQQNDVTEFNSFVSIGGKSRSGQCKMARKYHLIKGDGFLENAANPDYSEYRKVITTLEIKTKR
jgi:hypothetical protein